jgi:pyridoxine 5'-phosphate synthase PdxJ
MGRRAVQVVHQLHQQTLTFSLCKQRGTQALEEAKIVKSQALEIYTMNQVMQEKMEVLQKEVVDIQ